MGARDLAPGADARAPDEGERTNATASAAASAAALAEDAPRGPSVLSLARYTIPIHAILPLLIWALGRAWEGTTTITLVIVHVAFPLVLALTYPLWRGQGGDLLALLVANHVVTFVVGFLVIVLTS